MKEKNKNILKGVGVGALACLGMFTFSGCSMDLSQEQIDKLMYAVDNSQQFMEDTLHLLENQNAKMDAEQAYKLYRLAYNNFYLNKDGARDNIKITISSGDSLSQVVQTYKTEKLDVIIQQYFRNGELDDFVSFWYDDGENAYITDLQENEKWIVDNIHSEMNWNSINLELMLDLEFDMENIVSCNILPNENYELVVVLERVESQNNLNAILTYEITPDALLVKETVVIVENDNFAEKQNFIIDFEYGNVDVELIEDLLEDAKDATIVES